MNDLTDQSLMPFGDHRNRKMEDVPADYLLWLYDSMRKDANATISGARLAVFNYIEENYSALVKDVSDYIPEFKPNR